MSELSLRISLRSFSNASVYLEMRSILFLSSEFSWRVHFEAFGIFFMKGALFKLSLLLDIFADFFEFFIDSLTCFHNFLNFLHSVLYN